MTSVPMGILLDPLFWIKLVRLRLYATLAIVILSACSAPGYSQQATSTSTIPKNLTIATPSITPQAPQLAAPTSTLTPEPTFTPSPTIAPSQTPTLTPSSTPTVETPQPTLTPTYAVLRGTVLEQANCRYGPGAPYLYKYGLYEGYYMDVIGRNETGSWVVVQAIGGSNPCWVKASLLVIKGYVTSLAPLSLPLPESPYYGPLTGVWAERKGNDVIISWDPFYVKAGDEATENRYLVEAWLCTGNKLSFTPFGTSDTLLTVHDEAGCPEPSHARIYGVEKHGYTAWVTIPWPPP